MNKASKSSIKRLELTTFKLRSLLNITQAINENLTQEQLLDRYEELLTKDLNIGKVLVFKYEDTEGKPLNYSQIEMPDLPLLERAKEWSVSVKCISGNYRFYGYYSSNRKEIAIASPEETTFFHELAHAGHERLKGKLKPGQDPLQEIVAELSAHALCRLVGKRTADTTGNSYRYIETYARKIKMTPHAACLKVLTETEKVINLILKREH